MRIVKRYYPRIGQFQEGQAISIARKAAIAVLALLAFGIVFPGAVAFFNNDVCACIQDEEAVIQNAIDAMMAEHGITEVEASSHAVLGPHSLLSLALA